MFVHYTCTWRRGTNDHLLADEQHLGGSQKGNIRMTAEEYYAKGNEHRQRGEWGKAMSCYMEAIDLDPESPAVHAKEMLDNIMNYYCKDMYNP